MNNKERRLDNEKWRTLIHIYMGYMVTDGDEDERAFGNFMRKHIREAIRKSKQAQPPQQERGRWCR